MTETIVAAACRMHGITFSMPRPARHPHILQAFDMNGGDGPKLGHEQGFLTSEGRFVDREEAKQIAIAAGQKFTPRAMKLDDLYSEDLW